MHAVDAATRAQGGIVFQVEVDGGELRAEGIDTRAIASRGITGDQDILQIGLGIDDPEAAPIVVFHHGGKAVHDGKIGDIDTLHFVQIEYSPGEIRTGFRIEEALFDSCSLQGYILHHLQGILFSCERG